MSKARGLADLGNVYDDGALSNRNLIINSAMQVAQRGTSATYSSNTSRGFVCDRWYAEGYPLNMTVSQSTIAYDGINYNSSSLSSITGSWNFLQAVEDGYVFNVGKTLTLSFVASGSGTIQPITWIGTVAQQNFGSSFALTSTPTRYEITHTITGSGSGDDLYIGFSGSGGSFNVSLVQLEVGDTATPFEHPRSYGDELARCQRYYQNIEPAVGSFGHFSTAIMGLYNNGTQCFARYVFPVQMRATPSLAISALSTFDIEPFDEAPDAVYTAGGSSKSLGMQVTAPTSRTQGLAMMLTVDTAGGYINFDAEL